MKNSEEADALFEEEMAISKALIFYCLAMASVTTAACICAIASANVTTVGLYIAISYLYIFPRFSELVESAEARLKAIRHRRRELVSAALYLTQQSQ